MKGSLTLYLFMRGRRCVASGGVSNRAGDVLVVENSGSCIGGNAGDEVLVVDTTDEDRRDDEARGDSDRRSAVV